METIWLEHQTRNIPGFGQCPQCLRKVPMDRHVCHRFPTDKVIYKDGVPTQQHKYLAQDGAKVSTGTVAVVDLDKMNEAYTKMVKAGFTPPELSQLTAKSTPTPASTTPALKTELPPPIQTGLPTPSTTLFDTKNTGPGLLPTPNALPSDPQQTNQGFSQTQHPTSDTYGQTSPAFPDPRPVASDIPTSYRQGLQVPPAHQASSSYPTIQPSRPNRWDQVPTTTQHQTQQPDHANQFNNRDFRGGQWPTLTPQQQKEYLENLAQQYDSHTQHPSPPPDVSGATNTPGFQPNDSCTTGIQSRDPNNPSGIRRPVRPPFPGHPNARSSILPRRGPLPRPKLPSGGTLSFAKPRNPNPRYKNPAKGP